MDREQPKYRFAITRCKKKDMFVYNLQIESGEWHLDLAVFKRYKD